MPTLKGSWTSNRAKCTPEGFSSCNFEWKLLKRKYSLRIFLNSSPSHLISFKLISLNVLAYPPVLIHNSRYAWLELDEIFLTLFDEDPMTVRESAVNHVEEDEVLSDRCTFESAALPCKEFMLFDLSDHVDE